MHRIVASHGGETKDMSTPFDTDSRDVQVTELLGDKKYFRAFFWMRTLRGRGVAGN